MSEIVINRLPLPQRQKNALRQAKITQTLLADAIVKCNNFSIEEKSNYVDILYTRQPQMLGTIIVLYRLGVSEATMEPLMELLFIISIALENGKIELPPASEDLIELCYERVTSRMTQETDARLSELEKRKASQDYIEQHPEQWLLAYVFNLVEPMQHSTEEDRVVNLFITTAFNFVEIFTELLHPDWQKQLSH
jgi:hypothetical protein